MRTVDHKHASRELLESGGAVPQPPPLPRTMRSSNDECNSSNMRQRNRFGQVQTSQCVPLSIHNYTIAIIKASIELLQVTDLTDENIIRLTLHMLDAASSIMSSSRAISGAVDLGTHTHTMHMFDTNSACCAYCVPNAMHKFIIAIIRSSIDILQMSDLDHRGKIRLTMHILSAINTVSP